MKNNQVQKIADDLTFYLLKKACQSDMTNANTVLAIEFYDSRYSDVIKKAYVAAFLSSGIYFKHAALIINGDGKYELVISNFSLGSYNFEFVKGLDNKNMIK